MSLLLDALKRAEQEKLARQGDRDAGSPQEAANAPHASGLELQPIAASTGARAARDEASVHAAQVVFQAKTATRQDKARGKGMLWAAIAVALLLCAAASAYVWNAVNALTPKGPGLQRVPRPTPLTPASAGSVPPLSASITPAPGSAATYPAAAALDAKPPEPPATRVPAEPDRSAAERAAAKLLAQRPASAADPPVTLVRTHEPAQVPAAVTSGYEALRRGDLSSARRNYEAAVATEPNNLDAQLGLATTQARLGNRSEAASRYRLALQLDPRNDTALAGLASLGDFARADAIEPQLRDDASRNPQSASLHFALGNLYASQRRWRDAQAEYFEAYRLDPGSADLQYNLAVSLDNLGQTRLAADFYARALDTARGQSVQFDSAVAARRLAELRR